MEAVPSPDGRQIALQLWQHIWILDLDSSEARPLTDPITPPDEHWFPRWSPDGSSIVFYSLRSDAGLFVVPASGGTPSLLTEGEFDFWPSWSPDGKTIVFERLGGLYIIPAEGGTPERITADTIQAGNPAWSPDGKWIAFSSSGHLSIISPDGSSIKQVTTGESDRAPSWSPDNKSLFFISDQSGLPQVWTVFFENGEPRKLTDESDLYEFAPQWMPGRNVLVYTAGGKIHALDPNTGTKDIIPFNARLTLSRKPYKRRRPRIPQPGERLPARGIYRSVSSPDGKRIAFAALGDIWLRREDGSVEQLTSGSADDCDPSWSPDGRSICFVSNRTGDYQVWVVEVRGRELRQVTDTPGYDAETPLWHPSGESIVFTHTSRPPLKIIQATGGMPKPIVKTSGMNVRPIGWLPDDQSLVYSRLSYNRKTYEMKTTIERVNLDGKSLPIQVDVPGQAAFSALSPKGDKLAYVSHGELWIRPVGQDAISKLLIPGPAFYPSWSGDNQILFVSAGKLMRVNVETGIISQISHDLSYKVEPSTGSLLIRNARLLTPDPKEGLWDLYIKDGRISSIEKSSDKRRRADRELDVEGRTIIPGLFDIHSHIFRRFPAEGQLYWGVTSVSGAGGPGHWIVTQQEAIRSGRRLGPRIFPACGFVVPSAMNAFPQFFRIKTQDQLERFLDHLIGLEATQVKCFNRRDPWVEAAAISAAHKRGLPTLSHFIRPASVAAGQDRKEHAFYYSWGGGAGVRFQQDIIEILRKAKMTISTTITFPFVATKQGRERVANALSLPEVSSFLPPAQIKRLRRQIERKVPEATNLEWTRMQDASKANVLSARNAGIKIVVGTDYTVFVGYIAVHWEMEFLVEAGFSPVEALRAATQDAAATLGLEGQLGIIAPGAVADLVVLEADPLDDIRNTQKIHRIIKDGNIVDRDTLLKEMQK
jgi:Tol biopolymer transport system component/imidazolonepropionase-like amidohydrolase